MKIIELSESRTKRLLLFFYLIQSSVFFFLFLLSYLKIHEPQNRLGTVVYYVTKEKKPDRCILLKHVRLFMKKTRTYT